VEEEQTTTANFLYSFNYSTRITNYGSSCFTVYPIDNDGDRGIEKQ
jgi:hypothetical protein